jgi:hypothetical protein
MNLYVTHVCYNDTLYFQLRVQRNIVSVELYAELHTRYVFEHV